MMASSVYATPPPDLSGEDTALSDVSNSSQTNSSNNSNKITTTSATNKRTLSATSFLNTTNSAINNNSLVTTTASTFQQQQFSGSNINNNNNNTSLSDSGAPDLSKKRRKQSTPIRISANSLDPNDPNAISINAGDILQDHQQPQQQQSHHQSLVDKHENEQQSKLNKIFLTNLSQLQQQQQQHEIPEQQQAKFSSSLSCSVSSSSSSVSSSASSLKNNNNNSDNNDDVSLHRRASYTPELNLKINKDKSNKSNNNNNNNNSNHCNNNNNSNIEYYNHQNSSLKSLNHKIDDILPQNLSKGSDKALAASTQDGINKLTRIERENESTSSPSPPPTQALISVKKELSSSHENDWDSDERNANNSGSVNKISKAEDWLSLAGLPFPFPPEAAAALSASGYLPQLPLLGVGVPQVSQFSNTTLDGGLTRTGAPPLRIFNPEAYCDLCNKEFCNKYFLKTHKANKHGIYEPLTGNSEMPSISQLNQMQHVFQLQQQQLQLQQQQQQSTQRPRSQENSIQTNLTPIPQSSPLSPQSVLTVEATVFCDICFQKFTNINTMKKHRFKAHDISSINGNNGSSVASVGSNAATEENNKSDLDSSGSEEGDRLTPPFQMPDGFREDYTVEQEDTSFTPQIRKLSPQSMQQARDSNFSSDKLKRLGVTNPEAFCQICCKEYCNKYFLRTHKLKRHGLFMPHEDLVNKDEQRSPWHYVQTSPLNLIMGAEHHNSLLSQQQQLQLQHQQQKNSLDQQGESSKNLFEKVAEFNNHRHHHNHQQHHSTKSEKGNENTNHARRHKKEPKDHDETSSVDNDESDDNNKDIEKKSSSAASLINSLNAQDTEAISVDLQKLQSMILQLNDLNNQRIVHCGICGKEMENQYMLHAHMVSEHSNLGENNNNNTNNNNNINNSNNNGVKLSPNSTPLPSPTEYEICKYCDKEFTNIYVLKQHLIEIHGLSPTSPLHDGFITPDRPSISGLQMSTTPTQSERRSSGGGGGGGGAGNSGSSVGAGTGSSGQSYSMTPTSSYCEICNKELCNKYFMKTHMQRMHGIEIENGAQIGGVVCNVCNKELCSKYFLRVHKHNTHGIVDDGSPLPQPRPPNGDSMESDSSFPMEAILKPGEISDLSNRYFSHFTEVCPLCSRRFRSSKWLRAHLMSDHGKAGTEKLKELEQRLGILGAGIGLNCSSNSSTGAATGTGSGSESKPSSPTLKIPNGSFSLGSPDSSILPKTPLSSLFANEGNTSTGQKGFQCSYCSFSTPILALMFIHERSHSELNLTSTPSTTPTALPSTSLTPLGNIINLQSESAVSIAKDSQRLSLPTSGASATETPTSTPASTPIPSAPQEAVIQHHNFMNNKTDYNSVLTDMANITQRPAIYALPQDSGPVVMQSFLIEEQHAQQQLHQHYNSNKNNNSSNLLSSNNNSSNNNKRDDDLSTSTNNRSTSNQNRFVPSIVFLPVKERILTPMTISFNLTPA